MRWLLDPLVVSALVVGLVRLPRFGDHDAKDKKAWTKMLLPENENPCGGCGMTVGIDKTHSAYPHRDVKKRMPESECRPTVTTCLCPKLFDAYKDFMGSAAPTGAAKPHAIKVCPLGRDFVKVGTLASWFEFKADDGKASPVQGGGAPHRYADY